MTRYDTITKYVPCPSVVLRHEWPRRYEKSKSPESETNLFSTAAAHFEESAAAKKSYNPQLVSSIRSEEYSDVLRKNAEAYNKLESQRKQAFAMASKMADTLAKKIEGSNAQSAKIEQDLESLRVMLEKEKCRLNEELEKALQPSC